MIVNLIMAADDAGGIGISGGIPWSDPEDLKWFREMTMGGIVVIGYATAMGCPDLPGRKVHIMSRNSTPEQVMKKMEPMTEDGSQLWIAGGRKTYEMWLPYVDRFFISHIKGKFGVDTYAGFPLPWIR